MSGAAKLVIALIILAALIALIVWGWPDERPVVPHATLSETVQRMYVDGLQPEDLAHFSESDTDMLFTWLRDPAW